MFKLDRLLSRLLCGSFALALGAMLTLSGCPAGKTGGSGTVHSTTPAKKPGMTAPKGSSATAAGDKKPTDPNKPRTDVKPDNPNKKKSTAPKPDTNKKPGPSRVTPPVTR